MASLLDRVSDAIRTGTVGQEVKRSAKWFQQKIKGLQGTLRNQWSSTNAPKFYREAETKVNPRVLKLRANLGDLYAYYYKPKHMMTLPYYDMFPLILPVEKYSDGFLGINFHYLYPKERAVLLDQLMRFANNKNMDETTRIKLSYQSLGSFTRYKRAKPCLHRYLTSFMKSQMVLVPPADWGTALFLPVERFRKMNKTMVWAESASAMNRIGT